MLVYACHHVIIVVDACFLWALFSDTVYLLKASNFEIVVIPIKTLIKKKMLLKVTSFTDFTLIINENIWVAIIIIC